ncbi:MAG: hypothetical protein XE08_0673 [Parcubacteria bacterium 32_520]|nr:MAG: hypothetical protein XE08_0673 [Parcubacteria bacterium 32_520]
MAVSKVNKFHIFAHLSIKESLLDELQRLGCLQITSIEKSSDFHDWNGVEEGSENKTSAKLNKVKFCIELLSNYGNERKKGLQSLISSKETINYDKLVEIAQQFDYESLFQQCTTLDNEFT